MNNLALAPRRTASISEWKVLGKPITGRIASIDKKYLILETSKDEFLSVPLFDLLKSLVDVKKPKVGDNVRIGYVSDFNGKRHDVVTLEILSCVA